MFANKWSNYLTMSKNAWVINNILHSLSRGDYILTGSVRFFCISAKALR